MNCRPSILLFFVLSCCAVVGVDRYITTDAVRLCREANLYNCEELAKIQATQNAQVAVGDHLRAIRVLSDQLDAAVKVGGALARQVRELQQDNACLYETIKLLNNLLNEAGVKQPAETTGDEASQPDLTT